MEKSIWLSFVSMLPLVFLIAMVALLLVLVRRRNKAANKVSPTGLTPYGVGGWLSIFIFVAVFLSPLRGVGSLSSAFMDAELKNPSLLALSGWNDYKTASWTWLLCVVAWQWWVAHCLTKKFVRKSIFHVKLLLILGPLFGAGMDAISAKVLMNVSVWADALLVLISAFVVNGMWFFYFKYSKRVRNTYYSGPSDVQASEIDVHQPEPTQASRVAEEAPCVASIKAADDIQASTDEVSVPANAIAGQSEAVRPEQLGEHLATKLDGNRWGWVAALILCACVGLGGWWYSSIPQPPKDYYGLRLGMSFDEVRYVLGTPAYVDYEGKDDSFPGRVWVKVEEIPDGKSMRDYDGWNYLFDNESHRVSLIFDKTTNKLSEVSCYSTKGTCASILKIKTGMDEVDVLALLGKPELQTLKGGVKTMYYTKLNLVLYLEKLRVYWVVMRSQPHP
jgi:outer membrane protein assembly factor BamE (lipoprotein component of BamABCDE complex)